LTENSVFTLSKNAETALWKTRRGRGISTSFPHDFSTPCGEVCGHLGQIVEKTATSKGFSGLYSGKVGV
jgi:hypothetical protein